MGYLNIEGTITSPAIMFSTKGLLKIEGRAFPDNAVVTFRPLIE